MEAVPKGKATPIDLAKHTYWNLSGHKYGNILNHQIQSWASQITLASEFSVPAGKFLQAENTPFDFRTEKTIKSRFDEVKGVYYNNFVLDLGEKDEVSGLKRTAKVKDLSSSRVLGLWTDAPGVHFYNGNCLDGINGRDGAVYEKQAGLCLETQAFPNAINEPKFPSVVVEPGQNYKHHSLMSDLFLPC